MINDAESSSLETLYINKCFDYKYKWKNKMYKIGNNLATKTVWKITENVLEWTLR